jgi:negative regulator of flagellin synthesis FlgM
MKIGNLNNAAANAPVQGDRQAASSAKPASTGSAGSASKSGVTVELSSTASLMSDDGVDPSFDTAKVARIAQAIKDGKFQVNHEAIADKLIANAQELLGRSVGH